MTARFVFRDRACEHVHPNRHLCGAAATHRYASIMGMVYVCAAHAEPVLALCTAADDCRADIRRPIGVDPQSVNGRVLAAFRDARELPTQEIARRVRINYRKCLHHVQLLCARGCLEKLGPGRYALVAGGHDA